VVLLLWQPMRLRRPSGEAAKYWSARPSGGPLPTPRLDVRRLLLTGRRKCGRVQQVPLEDTGEGGFLLRPAGYADAYDVTLFGDGDGSLSVTFRWITPEDGPLPEPEARAAILTASSALDDGSFGVELAIDNLAETPEQASATITVAADNGKSLTFEAEQARQPCQREGSLYWDGPDVQGREAVRLGKPPFHYTVELVLDGKRYVAEATWPNDEIKGNEPSVRLDLRPPLPALR
jgi:hypothetical protein